MDVPFLDKYAKDHWEAILHFVAGIESNELPAGVRGLLQRSGLMQADPYALSLPLFLSISFHILSLNLFFPAPGKQAYLPSRKRAFSFSFRTSTPRSHQPSPLCLMRRSLISPPLFFPRSGPFSSSTWRWLR